MLVDVLAEPLAERGELAAADLLVDVGDVLRDPLPELRRGDVAERVRREVADRAAGPVRVLERAVRDVRHLDAEVLHHLRVPGLGNVGSGELAGGHVLLELEAEDDVEVVRGLVRLDADERRLHAVDGAVEALCVGAVHLRRERVLHEREVVLPERPAAPDEVLPHAALRLVERERRPSGDRRAHERAIDAVLVDAVPELVHRGEDRVHVVVVVSRRQADVVHAGPRGEGMHGLVEPPGVGGEAEVLEDLPLHVLLGVDRELALEARVVDGAIALGDLGDERHEAGLQLVEHRAYLRRLHARLEVVEQEVVVLVGGREALDVLLPQIDHLLEVRLEHRPVGLLAGLLPDGDGHS